MKKTSILLIFCLALSAQYSCSTANKATAGTATAATTEQSDDTEPAFRELVDLLRSEPGLDIRGNAPNYSITVRGKKSFLSGHDPLYVIDGIAVGTSYAQAANMINITDVASVNVLKGSAATSWGSRGANGVIEIRMKRGKKN